MYWYPKSTLGRISFWVGISAFAGIFLEYWTAMLFHVSIMLPAVLWVACVIGAGIAALIALIKHNDGSFLLFLPMLFALLGILFVVAELLFPH